jgi:hypothetical protein
MNQHLDRNGGAGDLPYQVILDLDDEKYAAAANNLVQLFAGDTDDSGGFDLEKALATAKGQSDLAIVGTINAEIEQSKSTLSLIVSNLIQACASAGAMGISSKDSKIKTALEGIFNDLKAQHGKPWLNFTTGDGDSARTTTYTYDMFYACHSPATDGFLAAGPLVFRVSTDASAAELLGGGSGQGDEDDASGVDGGGAPSSRETRLRIRYETHQFDISVKGFTVVKAVG